MRILIGGIAGAIAMFAWMYVAHMFTSLGYTGFHQLPDEAAVTGVMQSSIPQKGLYIFPWVDPKAKDVMQQYEAKAKTTPQGLLLYTPAGNAKGMDMKQMGIEFGTELAQTLIAALLLSMTAIAGYAMRAGFVALIGVIASISTNIPYWNWYGFPGDFTHAAIISQFVGYLAAALVIALIVKPRAA